MSPSSKKLPLTVKQARSAHSGSPHYEGKLDALMVMSIPRILSNWQSEPSIGGNIVARRSITARTAKTAPLPEDLHPKLRHTLDEVGITSLYMHQNACWQLAKYGENLVIATGTASGKTLGYNLPILDRILRDPTSRALYIYPTKALAQDQLAVLGSLLRTSERSIAAIYDGDTPQQSRPRIRAGAQIVLTNPDMLHIGILPHHTQWFEFFTRLEFVVLDEIHIYRGVFGSHVANVMRRLKRIAQYYGAAPQFFLTSATIANPEELASQLIEDTLQLVDEDTSACGTKNFLIYNPPIVDRDLGIRISALQESVRLADDLLLKDVQTILFGRSRRSVELALTYLRQSATTYLEDRLINKRIRGYRSGYLPRERREIERGLREGEIRTVVATNALELGIDIGGLDAVLLIGYPGSIAATWQQAGRSGRSKEASLAILVATSAPLDQFLAAHPDYFFGRSPESALINPDNLLILLDHLRCAAFELPFSKGEIFGQVDAGLMAEFYDLLQSQGVLHESGDKYFWMANQYPAQGISLRSASPETVSLQLWEGDQPTMIGQVDSASAHWLVHEEAVYMHEGRSFLVQELDLKNHIAILEENEPDYYTVPQRDTHVQLVELFDEMNITGGHKSHGELLVTSQVTGYRKIRWYTHETLGFGEVTLPPTELLTTGYWINLNETTIDSLREAGLWRSDPNRYGPNWNLQRNQARHRDNYTCQICGLPEAGQAHDVHHRIPFRQFDTYEIANRLDNLVTLCPACHRKAERVVRIRSGLSGLAFVLGHMAPLFLMCDSGDLGVHADPKLNLTSEDPGVVIYDQVPAGIGFSQRLFELHQELISRSLELVANCECQDGCPSCVGPGGELGMGGKAETLAILNVLSAPSL